MCHRLLRAEKDHKHHLGGRRDSRGPAGLQRHFPKICFPKVQGQSGGTCAGSPVPVVPRARQSSQTSQIFVRRALRCPFDLQVRVDDTFIFGGECNSKGCKPTPSLHTDKLASPRYNHTGDKTPGGCIWAMVLEKAWAAFVSDAVGKEPNYMHIDNDFAVDKAQALCNTASVCQAIAGWKGHGLSDVRQLASTLDVWVLTLLLCLPPLLADPIFDASVLLLRRAARDSQIRKSRSSGGTQRPRSPHALARSQRKAQATRPSKR
jgi:hypothetical protein